MLFVLDELRRPLQRSRRRWTDIQLREASKLPNPRRRLCCRLRSPPSQDTFSRLGYLARRDQVQRLNKKLSADGKEAHTRELAGEDRISELAALLVEHNLKR